MIRPLLACLLSAIVACTPLGLWIYDDPTLEVSRVRVDRNGAGGAPVVVGLAVWNPNLYALSTARLELRLRLDDMTVGRFDRDSIIPLPQTGLADLALPLTVPSGRIRERIRAMASGTHRFSVEGRATLSTPFGEREVPFEHTGDLAFGGTAGGQAKADTTETSSATAPSAKSSSPLEVHRGGIPTTDHDR